jgi:alpha-tubulin suppressor-like RCC1 family protein
MNALCLQDGTAVVWPAVYGERMSPQPFYYKVMKEKFISVSLGFDFVVYLSHIGKVYTMGKTNSYGELGHGDFEPRHDPTLIY